MKVKLKLAACSDVDTGETTVMTAEVCPECAEQLRAAGFPFEFGDLGGEGAEHKED